MISCPTIALLPHESASLRFRLLRAGDLTEFHRYRSDAGVARLQGWSPMSLQDAERFIHDHSSLRSLNPGAWSQLAVVRKEDDLLVGDIGLWLSADSSEAEFGLTISPRFQRRGWGSETTRGAIKLLFHNPAVQSIRAHVDARNLACRRTLESAGMELVASRGATYKGKLCREHEFSIQRSG